MSRPLRIEYPDAWYHVMNRGRRGEEVFLDRTDYSGFLKLLIESCRIWNVRICAYCLMPSHYHLLLQTPDANLSRFMRHVNGVYTQRFNRSHQYDGPLFRGRFKSILVEADSYLLELVRYIHRNPLRVGLVDKLDEYSWSSHRGYISDTQRWSWLHKGFVLSMLIGDRKPQRGLYRAFVGMEPSEEITEMLERKRWPSVLGNERFVNWVKDRFFEQMRHQEVPASRILAPDREEIKHAVCRSYGVNEADLLHSRRGVSNEPRNVAMYLMRGLRADGLDEICHEFHLKRYSSASSALERVRGQMSKDRRFKRRVQQLEAMLTRIVHEE